MKKRKPPALATHSKLDTLAVYNQLRLRLEKAALLNYILLEALVDDDAAEQYIEGMQLILMTLEKAAMLCDALGPQLGCTVH